MYRSKIELHNVDCLPFMKQCEDNQFDLAIVDPPYGINADKAQNAAAEARKKANGKSKAGRGWKEYKTTDWDNGIPNAEYWNELFRISKNQIVWGGNYMTEHLPPSMGWIIWDKGQRDFSLADGEMAWTSFDKALRIFEMSRGKALAKNNEKGGRFHPTQKPTELYEWILSKYADEGDKIIDTHLGSGSIAIACDKMKFDLVGTEIDSDYFTEANKRLDQHRRQQTLF